MVVGEVWDWPLTNSGPSCGGMIDVYPSRPAISCCIRELQHCNMAEPDQQRFCSASPLLSCCHGGYQDRIALSPPYWRRCGCGLDSLITEYGSPKSIPPRICSHFCSSFRGSVLSTLAYIVQEFASAQAVALRLGGRSLRRLLGHRLSADRHGDRALLSRDADVWGHAVPVTLFTFGMLLLTIRPVPNWLLVVPAIWSLIGGSAAIVLNVPQDWLLLFRGGIAVPLIVVRDRRVKQDLRTG